MASQVTVLIPTIPPREEQLAVAIESVTNQTIWPDLTLMTCVDHKEEGPGVIRNRMMSAVVTPWIAFLDDDDELFPDHLEKLLNHQADSGADLVYPWFEENIKRSSISDKFGKPFNERTLRRANYIPITYLVRTELARKAKFPEVPTRPGAPMEDWDFLIRLLDLGAKFSHLPEKTWRWNWHGEHTSGRNWRDVYG